MSDTCSLLSMQVSFYTSLNKNGKNFEMTVVHNV